MVYRLFALLVFATASSLPLSTFAQSGLSVRGSVADLTGAIVPGATVRLESPAGTTLAETHADAHGDFAILNVTPGDVTLVVPAATGFAAAARPLHLTANLAGLKLTLTPSSVAQEINVGDDQPLSTDASANQDTVALSAPELRTLPIFDQDPIAALAAFLDASSAGSGGVTLIVDGLEVKRVGVSASAIQEVRINNDPYSTEFTRPGRGRIEIITKPGSPDFHGEVNFTFRDSVFNARNHFAVVRPPEARRIFEGNLSGPVGHGGHTTFLASGARKEQDTAVVVNAALPTGPDIENVLTPNHNSQASFRVTHDFSTRHRTAVGYTFELDTHVNAGVGALVLPEAGSNTDSREDDLIFNDRVIVTPNLINQLAMKLEKDEDVSRSVTNGPSIRVAGYFTRGGAQSDSHRTENTLHFSDVVSWNRGRHYIRFGAQLPQVSRRAVDDNTNRLGSYRFTSLDTFAARNAYVFTQEQGLGRGLYWIVEGGAFVQDQIKLTPRLQMSVGVRYDRQTYLEDANNFTPRLSFAYAPGKAKTILRTGAGVFYDRTGGDFPAIYKLHDGIVLKTIQLQNQTYPVGPTTGLAGLPSSIVVADPHQRSPYSYQYSAGVERQIVKGATVIVGYRGFVQVKSFRSRDINAPLPTAVANAQGVYPRPDPRFGQIQQVESSGRQLGNALDVQFRGKLGPWFSGQAQYTLSRNLSNTGGISYFPQNQYQPNLEWGRADGDRLHSVNILGTIHPEHLLSLGIALNVNSNTPYTEFTGTDDFHTGLGNARPVGVGRNTLRAAGAVNLNLQWEHDFPLTKARGDDAKVLSAGLGAFNVLNHTNPTGYIGDLTSTRFAQPTSSLPARQLQLSLGFRF